MLCRHELQVFPNVMVRYLIIENVVPDRKDSQYEGGTPKGEIRHFPVRHLYYFQYFQHGVSYQNTIHLCAEN